MDTIQISRTLAETFYEASQHFLEEGNLQRAALSIQYAEVYYKTIEDLEGVRKCRKLEIRIGFPLPQNIAEQIFYRASARLDRTILDSNLENLTESDLELLKREIKEGLGVRI